MKKVSLILFLAFLGIISQEASPIMDFLDGSDTEIVENALPEVLKFTEIFL